MPGNGQQKKQIDKKSRDVLFDHGTIRVILIGCLAIALSLIIMSLSSIFITRDAVVLNFKKAVIRHMAGSIASSIDARIERAVDVSLLLSSDPMLDRWVRSHEKDQEAGRIAQEKMLELVRDLGYDTSFVTSALTGNYWSCDVTGAKLIYTVSTNDPADAWFFDILKIQKRYEINVNYDKKLKDTFVWIDALVGDVNAPTAVTGVGMNLSRVIKDLLAADGDQGARNEVWLVDDQGDIRLSKDLKSMNRNLSDFVPESLKSSILAADSVSGTFISTEYKGQKGELHDIVYKKIQNTKWSLVVEIPRSESLGFLNSIIYSTLIACLFVILVVVVMFNVLAKRIADPYKRALLINEELERKINERTKELHDKNVKIQDSFDYAKIIQKTILPSADDLKQIFKEHFVIWEPRDTVGGDFYWVRKFDDGVLVILGDCTGHGVPGALMTMAVNAIINHVVDEICHDDPAWILSEMDRLLKQNLRRDQASELIHDGLDAGILYISRNHKILFSGAQIPAWINAGNHITEIRGDRESIGSDRTGKGKVFENTEIGYVPGMTLYMATDGLKDQPGGLHKLPYGKSRLISLLESVGKLPPDEQRKAVLEAYIAYAGEEQRRDDVAMIAFKIGGWLDETGTV